MVLQEVLQQAQREEEEAGDATIKLTFEIPFSFFVLIRLT